MPARVLALLLAILMAAGAASTVLATADDAMSQRDDGLLDPEPVPTPALVGSAVALATPARHELSLAFAPSAVANGRVHCVSVFRPPR